MDNTEKTRENRLRRLADRQGLRIIKQRGDFRSRAYMESHGQYLILDGRLNAIMGSADTLDELEESLTEKPTK